ncbi:MAG: hypothetical protein KGZ69_05955 [Methylomonas sp.]|nr:hypothetical protein [Methylomonas sp.]
MIPPYVQVMRDARDGTFEVVVVHAAGIGTIERAHELAHALTHLVADGALVERDGVAAVN